MNNKWIKTDEDGNKIYEIDFFLEIEAVISNTMYTFRFMDEKKYNSLRTYNLETTANTDICENIIEISTPVISDATNDEGQNKNGVILKNVYNDIKHELGHAIRSQLSNYIPEEEIEAEVSVNAISWWMIYGIDLLKKIEKELKEKEIDIVYSQELKKWLNLK